MSAPSIADPAVTPHPATRRRPRALLRAVPDTTPRARPAAGPAVTADPPTSHPGASDRPAAPLTVTISVDGGAPEARDRFLAALRDLVETAGQGAVAVTGEPGAAAGVPGEPGTAAGIPGRPGTAAAVPDGPGVVHVDPAPRVAFRGGQRLDLSRLEYDLLLFFARHPRQVFSRGQLLAEVWGHEHTGARTVDVHVSRLRQKLGGPELIATVYGVGYRLADAAPVRVVPSRGHGVSWTA